MNISYRYNAAGDLQQKTTPQGTSSYTYDAQGNLREASLPDGKTIRYDIDPLNRRVGKKTNGVQQWRLVWMDNLRPLAQLQPDGSVRALFYYGDRPNVPEAMEKEGTLYRIVSDHLGSVRLVLNANTGTIAQQMDYDGHAGHQPRLPALRICGRAVRQRHQTDTVWGAGLRCGDGKVDCERPDPF